MFIIQKVGLLKDHKIDEQKDYPGMKGLLNQTCTFNVQNQNQKPYKYIKITQTDLNWANKTLFAINCIELYGSLI